MPARKALCHLWRKTLSHLRESERRKCLQDACIMPGWTVASSLLLEEAKSQNEQRECAWPSIQEYPGIVLFLLCSCALSLLVLGLGFFEKQRRCHCPSWHDARILQALASLAFAQMG